MSGHMQNLSVEHAILAVLVCLVAGVLLAASEKHWLTGLAVLTVLSATLNLRYFLVGMDSSIAFFISIYDPFAHLGRGKGIAVYLAALTDPAHVQQVPHSTLADYEGMLGMGPCEVNNTCTMLPYYEYHPVWAPTFYRRFVSGSSWRRTMLYGHIALNTFGFALCFLLFFVFPGTRSGSKTLHRLAGWAAVLATAGGVSMGFKLGLEHGVESTYGGFAAVLGWVSMAATVLGCLVPGVQAAVRRDIAAHKTWMARFYGSLWGSFLVFRAQFLIWNSVFIRHESAAILISVYTSAPLGVCLAEWARARRSEDARERKRVE